MDDQILVVDKERADGEKRKGMRARARGSVASFVVRRYIMFSPVDVM